MSTCRRVASDQPRALTGRHHDHCTNPDCPGCQPCPIAHCGTCGHRHVDELTCPHCIDDARTNLNHIRDLSTQLLHEAIHRGVDSEAADLHGPTADPNAWRQRGRHGAAYTTEQRLGENHPLWVLGTWDMLVTEHYGQLERTTRVTIADAAGYLNRNLTDLAQDPDFAFNELAHELRACRTHLEAVLHDGEQIDAGAPCMTCGVPLRREWGKLAAADGWRCPRCREFSTEDQYRFAVAHLHREEATHLTARDMEIRTGVAPSTVRAWASKGHVEKRRDSERTVYAVADVLRHAERAGRVS